MPQLPLKFLTQDVDQLLEDPEFRTFALRPDAVLPTGAGSAHQARMILLGLTGDKRISLPGTAEKDASFAALMAKTQATAPAPAVRRLWPRVLAIAATVFLLLTAGLILLRSPAGVTYATGNAERLDVSLPDGSTVTLNANTTLELPAGGWATTERSVSLDGEAFFDVAKDKARPFLVVTDDAEIRVLGTRFNVRDRRGSTRIFLEEGRVNVGWPGTRLPETSMSPNEIVTLKSRGNSPVLEVASVPGRHLAWKSGHLEFNRLPLAEALNEVADIYGIKISCDDPLLEKMEISSAGIPTDNLRLALRLMERALGLRIETQNKSAYQVFAAE